MLSTTLMRAVTETNLGTALQADGRLDEAIDHYHRAIALAPDFPPAYNNLGTTLRAKGQLAEAIATYQQALRVRPDYPDAQYNLANALLDAGKPAEAIEHFRVALQTIPASVDVHNNLGIALMDQGRRDEAIAEFRAALELDPDSAQSHRNLANALGTAHQLRRGDRALPPRVAARPGRRRRSTTISAACCWRPDRLDEAIAEFRAALQHRSEVGQDAQQPRHRARLAGTDGRGDRRSSGRRSWCSRTSRTRSATSRSRCRSERK